MGRPSLLSLAVLLAASLFAISAGEVSAQSTDSISISHTPPSGVAPGEQILLTAVLRNATGGSVVWRNATMTVDAVVPITNLSEERDGGWAFAAWLPAQFGPTQVRYSINASNPGGFRTESYFLTVDYPGPTGLIQEQQDAWILTLVASLAMTVSLIAMLYWYTGRRLRREGP